MDLAHNRTLPKGAECLDCPVGQAGPCQWFAPSVRARITSASLHRRFAKGMTILPSGQSAQRVGVILAGLVKITTLDEQGNEHLLQLLHPGELIGDPFGGPLPFSCDAATDVRLCMTPAAVILEAFEHSPSACTAHLKIMIRQQFEQHCAQLALRGRSSLQRVAYWIATQAPSGNADRVLSIRIVLSRKDLASLLDMTVETLSRSLHKLQDKTLIKLVTPERLEIRDPVGLLRLAGEQDGLRKSLLQRTGWEWGARAINLPRFSSQAATRHPPSAPLTRP